MFVLKAKWPHDNRGNIYVSFHFVVVSGRILLLDRWKLVKC